MFCPKCGKKFLEGAKFCANCGYEYSEEVKKNEKNNVLNKYVYFLGGLIVFACVVLAAMFFTKEKENVNKNEIVETAIENNDAALSEDDGTQDRIEKQDVEEILKPVEEEMEITVSEEEMNPYGNTNANLKNGGWVTEQGDWNYYAINSCILKENVISGEKLKIYESYGGQRFLDLHIAGEWLYFRTYGSFEIRRIKTDGTYCQSIFTDWADKVREWDVWNGNIYAIIQEPISAMQCRESLVKINWENGTYDLISEIISEKEISEYDVADETTKYYGWDWKLLGVEDDKAYFTSKTHQGLENGGGAVYSILTVDVNNGVSDVFEWTEGMELNDIYQFCLKSGMVCCVREVTDSNESLYSYLDIENELMCSISVSKEMEVWNYYGDVESLIYGGRKIIKRLADGTEEVVAADEADWLCVAREKVYYRCNNKYYRINIDGTEWEELLTDEYESVAPPKWTE